MATAQQRIVINAQYLPPTPTGFQRLERLVTYIQYRINPDGRDPATRWHHHGLGSSVVEVTQACAHWRSAQVLARTLVISPQVPLMLALPEPVREPFLCRLTETILARWFALRGLPQPEYSYVIHYGSSQETLPGGRVKDVEPGQEFLHTHVIVAGTVPQVDGRESYLIFPEHLAAVHREGNRLIEQLWRQFHPADASAT